MLEQGLGAMLAECPGWLRKRTGRRQAEWILREALNRVMAMAMRCW